MSAEHGESLERMTDKVEALTARAEKAEAEVVRLTARVAELSGGIVTRGWWCICDRFNGEEHSPRTECSACGRAKTVREPKAVST